MKKIGVLALQGAFLEHMALLRQLGAEAIPVRLPQEISVLGEPPFHAVFIRAPWIESAGSKVEMLASLPDGTPVAAREDNIVVSAFPPELTSDARLHAYSLNIR